MKAKSIFILLIGLVFCSCSEFTGSEKPLYIGNYILPDTTRNVLVAYFSRSGNTENVAKAIAENTGGTLYRIERKVPYPEDFKDCASEAKSELNDSVFPALKDTISDFDRYDVIFVGGPVWWHTAPMPILSFLKKSGYDFSGKIVVPFCSYANMFPHETLLEIVKATPNSLHPDGFISEEGDTTGIAQWLDDINLKLK
ncbi:flavodoxin [uncultured Duncaniella sp.]|uniref:flavodoxin n=1 Tax=uncultured Duncaniella sp. TaxID=2768039 RepID=UPI0025E8F2D3|nr:flavodoxin [uncultured Duncaniella sp.]